MTLRKDILAVMDRDPAVRTSPDVILYFKGFQALQTHRVAHWLWSSGRSTLALFVQSRANTGEEKAEMWTSSKKMFKSAHQFIIFTSFTISHSHVIIYYYALNLMSGM